MATFWCLTSWSQLCANDWPINDCPPECVPQDTGPLKYTENHLPLSMSRVRAPVSKLFNLSFTCTFPSKMVKPITTQFNWHFVHCYLTMICWFLTLEPQCIVDFWFSNPSVLLTCFLFYLTRSPCSLSTDSSNFMMCISASAACCEFIILDA